MAGKKKKVQCTTRSSQQVTAAGTFPSHPIDIPLPLINRHTAAGEVSTSFPDAIAFLRIDKYYRSRGSRGHHHQAARMGRDHSLTPEPCKKPGTHALCVHCMQLQFAKGGDEDRVGRRSV
jgi:hypothetical protein